jgi:hypothetical protein
MRKSAVSPTSTDQNQRGAAIYMVAGSLLAILGIAALAIDGGNVYRERGHLQNAADNVAMAAAYEDCTGGLDPVGAGVSIAAANGYIDNGATVSVVVAPEAGNWRATVGAGNDTFFGRLLGLNRLDTSATALAGCTIASGHGYAIFAASTTCADKTLDWSGSNSAVEGSVHSNDQVKVGGSGNSVLGEATRVDTGGGSSGGIPWTTAGAPLDWPVTYDILDFLPVAQGGNGSVQAATLAAGDNYVYVSGKLNLGDYAVGGVIPDGVYVAGQELDVSDSNLIGNVTLVSAPTSSNRDKGTIDFSGSNLTLTPYWNGLLAFSDGRKNNTAASSDNCDFAAVKMAGSNTTWEGTVYAPRGMIEYSGSSNSSLNGSLIGNTVKLNGSDLNITYEDFSGGGDPLTTLIN